MSMHNVRAVVDRMNLREALIAPHYNALVADFQQLLDADQGLEEAASTAHRKELLAVYGYTTSDETKPFAFSNGVAIIPVQGLLLNRFSWSWGFVTGYNFIRNQIIAALADPDVEYIVLDINSCGGEAAGCFELTDYIAEARLSKKILAVVDSNCYSGAYAIASACTAIYVTPSGGAGSIGVYTMHFNIAGMLKQAGIEVTLIEAGTHKTDGNPYEALPADVKANIQANVEATREVFVSSVARYRGMDAAVIRDTEGRTYRADQALELGLIDAIQPPQKALEVFFENEGAPPGADDYQDDPQENVMTEATKPGEAAPKPAAAVETTPAAPAVAAPAAAAPAAEVVTAEQARKAERERIQAITSLPEAEGRAELAMHFATSTDMTPDQAKAALAKSPKEKVANDPFKQAMNNGNNPEITAGGAEGEGAEGDEPKTPEARTARILAAQTAATGRVHATPATK